MGSLARTVVCLHTQLRQCRIWCRRDCHRISGLCLRSDDRSIAVLTWLFNHTNGSVLLAMLAHASVNTALAFGPMTRSATLISFLAVLAIGVAITIATRGRLGYRKELSVLSAVDGKPDGAGS